MVLVIRRDFRKDERGVASTVGTIMALLVFLTFLSLIVNQYVPTWMKDSEASHMDAAVAEFGDLKSAIDFQTLGAIMAQNAGTIFVPGTTSSAVGLGVDGVPIFTAPTTGALISNGSAAPWFVRFQYCITVAGSCVSTSNVWQNSSGQIDLSVQNRYYPAGDVVYENGAVIRSQPDGQIVRAPPTFQPSVTGTNLSVAFELINLYGEGSAAGTSTQIVNSKVFGVNQQNYGRLTGNLYINHTSAYGLAWFNFFNSTLSSTLKATAFTYSSIAGTTTVAANLPGFPSNKYYQITLVQNPVTGLSSLSLVIFNQPTSPLSLSFTLQQAFVNVGVGQMSNNV